MTAFTPGPWRVQGDPRDPHAWDVYAGASKIAHLPWDCQPNARLIAAAPDLYAALQECALRLGALVMAAGDFSDANAQAIDHAGAALAKAEGQEASCISQ